MAIGLVGRKCGMTRVFTAEGEAIPVSVIEVQANRVTQIKTQLTDGYDAIQVTTGSRKVSKLNKPLVGHFAKAKVEPGRGLWEFRLSSEEAKKVKLDDASEAGEGAISVGSAITVEHFKVGQKVDVTGITKGKGFAGTVKRHNFATQDASHGNSLSHRAPGSIGQNQSPGKVFKGKKMSGQMGNKQRTVQSLEIIRIDVEKNLLLVKGAVPGAKNGNVIVRPAVKARVKEHSNES